VKDRKSLNTAHELDSIKRLDTEEWWKDICAAFHMHSLMARALLSPKGQRLIYCCFWCSFTSCNKITGCNIRTTVQTNVAINRPPSLLNSHYWLHFYVIQHKVLFFSVTEKRKAKYEGNQISAI